MDAEMKYDGGPAYPVPARGDHDPMENGMTLRDYFAGQALSNQYANDAGTATNVAKWAYQIADAMIEERMK